MGSWAGTWAWWAGRTCPCGRKRWSYVRAQEGTTGPAGLEEDFRILVGPPGAGLRGWGSYMQQEPGGWSAEISRTSAG